MTNPLTLAAVRAIKSEAEKATQAPWVEHYGAVMHIDGGLAHYLPQQSNQPKIDAAFMAHARTNVPALCDSYVTLVEALRLAVDSPHEVHNKAIAELLATINPPSAEAQTEGDGG